MKPAPDHVSQCLSTLRGLFDGLESECGSVTLEVRADGRAELRAETPRGHTQVLRSYSWEPDVQQWMVLDGGRQGDRHARDGVDR